jgi:hypothetical protein
METEAQRIAERSLARMLWLLRAGRYFLLSGGLAYFFWQAAQVAFGTDPWTLETIITVFFVSLAGPTLLWLTGSWAERLAKEVNWRYAEIIAVNRMAQEMVIERADLATTLDETRIQVRLLQTVNKILSRQFPPSEAVERMLDGALDTLKLDAAELWLATPDGAGLKLLSHRGLFPDAFRERVHLAFGEGLPGAVAEMRTPLVSMDLSRDRRLERPSIYRSGFTTYAAAPLFHQGDQLIGVLGAASRRPRQFSKSEIEALVQMGMGLASVVRPLMIAPLNHEGDNVPVMFVRSSGGV